MQTIENKKQNQKTIFYKYLLDKVETASMVADATGVPQKNGTRYKRQLEKAGLIAQVYRKRCKRTGRTAWYITADKTQFPKDYPQQFNLFEQWKQ